jgi:hypothetical protein
VEDHARLPRQQLVDPVEGEEQGAGEDVLLDEVDAAAELP